MIGENIRIHREKAGLTIIELANKIEASRSGVYQWENERTDISAKKLIAICKVLKISSKDILGV